MLQRNDPLAKTLSEYGVNLKHTPNSVQLTWVPEGIVLTQYQTGADGEILHSRPGRFSPILVPRFFSHPTPCRRNQGSASEKGQVAATGSR